MARIIGKGRIRKTLRKKKVFTRSITPLESQSKFESSQQTVIETDIDRLLKIIEKKYSITVRESAKILNVSEENIERLGKILEEHKLVRLGYTLFGKLILSKVER